MSVTRMFLYFQFFVQMMYLGCEIGNEIFTFSLLHLIGFGCCPAAAAIAFAATATSANMETRMNCAIFTVSIRCSAYFGYAIASG